MTIVRSDRLPPVPAGIDRPRISIEHLARGTWTVYRRHLGAILAGSGIVAIPVYLAQVALGVRLVERLTDLLLEADTAGAFVAALGDDAVALAVGIGGLFLVPFLAWPVLVGTITVIAVETWGMGPVALSSALARGLAAYPALLAGSVLTALPALAAAGAVLGLSALVLGTVGTVGFLVVPAYVAGLGLVLVAVTYLGVRFAVVGPAIVIDALGPLDALRRSWWLTTGNLWRVLGAIVLVSVAVAIAQRFAEGVVDAALGSLPLDPTVPALVLYALPAVAFPAFGPILGALLLLGLEGAPTLLAVDGAEPPGEAGPYVG
ncbi:MAG TPA: hypothetical protein VLA23_11610 [Candidatus Limnocylindrales bacterium]|nr:hypothetical protein [Candidatus Limnocylindrales bacterium]